MITNEKVAYLSSFWTLASGLAGTTGGAAVSDVARGTVPPPPPRRGFAILPAKLSGEETELFCAEKKKVSNLQIGERQAREYTVPLA